MNNRIIVSEIINEKFSFTLINNVESICFVEEHTTPVFDGIPVERFCSVKIISTSGESYVFQSKRITEEYVREFKKLLINATENTLLEVRL